MRLRIADLKARVDAGEIGDIVVMHQTSRWSIAEDGPGSGQAGLVRRSASRAGRRADRRRDLLD